MIILDVPIALKWKPLRTVLPCVPRSKFSGLVLQPAPALNCAAL